MSLDLESFLYSKSSHLQTFQKFGYFSDVDYNACDLKPYQILLAYNFISTNLAENSKILMIGADNFNLLDQFNGKGYEFWKIESLNEFIDWVQSKNECKVFRAGGGSAFEVSNELPKYYFDFVFSLGTLTDLSDNEDLLKQVFKVLNELLAVRGVSLHTFDSVLKENTIWFPAIASFLMSQLGGEYLNIEAEIRTASDLYRMSEAAYEMLWQPYTGQPYQKFGLPFSLNITWTKDLDSLDSTELLNVIEQSEIPESQESEMQKILLQRLQKQVLVMQRQLDACKAQVAALEADKEWLTNQLDAWMKVAKSK